MEEQLVSIEVARLLKEKGFCNGSTHYYSNLNSKQELHKNDNGAVYINGMELDYIEAPTQSLVQKWLRDKHGFFVLVGLDHKGLYYHMYNGKIEYKGDHYLSYESALEEGLLMALRYL